MNVNEANTIIIKVQNLGELCMRGTANRWAELLVCVYLWSPTSSMRRV